MITPDQHTHTLLILVSALVESSPQALPLAAADITAFVRSKAVEINTNTVGTRISVEMLTISMEDCDEALEKTILNRVLSLVNSYTDSCTQGGEVLFVAVAFSMYVWNRTLMFKTASLVTSQIPEAFLCVGGPEVTAGINDVMRTSFDYVIRGEGESAIWNIVCDISAGNGYKNNNAPIKQALIVQGIREDCKLLPSPYLSGAISPVEFGGVLWEAARGCPFSCAYCYESKGDRSVRFFPLERLEAELRFFSEQSVRQVFVLDPTFNANKERAVHVLSLIERFAKDVFFHFEIRAEYLDTASVKAFSRICCSLQIGLQSAQNAVMECIGRPWNRKDFSRKIALLNEAELVFGFDVIYGLPQDTLAGFCDTLNYALSLHPNHIECFKLSVLPGTVLHEKAHDLHITFMNEAPYHVLETKGWSPSDIQKAHDIAQMCTLFYSQGRAVPWFLSLLKPLKIQPSVFFTEAVHEKKLFGTIFSDEHSLANHVSIEDAQVSFMHFLYERKKLLHLFDAVRDIIKLNGALARAQGEGDETILEVTFHPEDLLGYGALDIVSFVEETCTEKTTLRVFANVSGVDMEILHD